MTQLYLCLQYNLLPCALKDYKHTVFLLLRFDMPRIPPKVLDNVFYLYRTRSNAEGCINIGGTGFIVSIPSVKPDKAFRYFVTNWHVAVRDGFSVVRVDKMDGTSDFFEYDCSDWHFLPKFDIAVIPVVIAGGTHKVAVVSQDAFLTLERKKQEKIGPGDDVFMVGRFVDHKLLNQSATAVRFGHISMDPASVLQSNGVHADTYCIDLHSRSGYSGSPVFVYRTPGYDLEESLGVGDEAKLLMSGVNHLSLLGIHWGQFPEIWEVVEGGKLKVQDSKESLEPLLTDGQFIKGLSGMTCVLPAWSILEVLNLPNLKKVRDAANVELM